MSLMPDYCATVSPAPLTVRLRAAFKHHELERRLLPAFAICPGPQLYVGAALGAYTWPLSRLWQQLHRVRANRKQADYLRRAFGVPCASQTWLCPICDGASIR